MTHIVSRCCYLSVQVNAWVSFVCKKTSRQINIRAESVVFFFLFCIIFFPWPPKMWPPSAQGPFLGFGGYFTTPHSCYLPFFQKGAEFSGLNEPPFIQSNQQQHSGGRLFETTITVSRLGTLTLHECQCSPVLFGLGQGRAVKGRERNNPIFFSAIFSSYPHAS